MIGTIRLKNTRKSSFLLDISVWNKIWNEKDKLKMRKILSVLITTSQDVLVPMWYNER